MAAIPGWGQITAIKTNLADPQGATLGNKVVFVNATTGELGSTDGSVAGTVTIPLTTVAFAGANPSKLNNKLIFTGTNAANGTELWSTDGTVAGTVLIKDINPGAASSNPAGGDDGFTVVGTTLYFTAEDGTNGRELWKTDGTLAGTMMVKDLNAIAIAFPYISGSTVPNILFFTVTTPANGLELWRSDGTSGGTTILKDITAGTGSTTLSNMIAGNGTYVFFLANNGVNGAELWRSDGTDAGTILLTDINPGLASSFNIAGFGGWNWNFHFKNNILYFQPNDASITGARLYKSDGTFAGTTLVTDLSPSGNGYLALYEAIDWGEYFYFQGNGELYRSNGTAAGTALVKDINPGPNSSNPELLRPRENLGDENIPGLFAGGRFFFLADDGTNGSELWVSDGSTAGTMLVKDIYPGLSGSYAGSDAYYYTKYKFFFNATNGTNGYELWQTDGTTAGTSMVMDINAGLADSDIQFFGVANTGSRVVFKANNGDGADIYLLDATVIPFPIRLVDFTAELKNADVLLQWNSMQEQQFSHFNIQRSTNGISFSNIARINGTGTTAAMKYDYLDRPASKAANYYYRLQLVDKNGSSTFSNTVSVKMRAGFASRITTTTSTALVYVSDVAGPLTVKLIDLNGRQLYQQHHNVNGTAVLEVPLTGLAYGIYILSIEYDGQVFTERILR